MLRTTNGDLKHLQATALSAVANAVVITDRDGTIEWINPAFTAQSGYSADEAVGRNPRLLQSGAHPEGFFAQFWDTIRAGRVWRGEIVERHKDGHLYTVSQTITPLVGAHGSISHFVAVHEDISDRLASQQRLQALFDHAYDAILLADDDGRYVDANPAACVLTGYSRDELLTMTVADLAAPEHTAEAASSQFDSFVSGGVGHGDLTIRHRSGRTIETEYRGMANILPGLHLAMVRDMTQRNASVRALGASEARFRGLAHNASDIVAMVHVDDDHTMTIDYINPAATRIFGLPSPTGSVPPSSIRDRCRPQDTATFDRLMGTTEQTTARGMVRFADAQGRWVWLDVVATVTATSATHRTIELIARDVSDAQRTRAALQAALDDQRDAATAVRALNETKNRLLRNISHELRTPLAVIVGFAEILSRSHGTLDADQIDDFHRRIRGKTERILELLNDLSDINRPLKAGDTLHREATDLADLVASAVREFAHPERRINLELAPTVMAVDSAKVRRIVHNLLTNAVRHTPDGTPVTVRLHPTDDGARLTVEDDGPGIPTDTHNLLFEPFYQGEATGKASQPGVGLGLPVVRALAEAHGGHAWVDPDRRGTCIHVTLSQPTQPHQALPSVRPTPVLS